jgi:non-specific protein-tyrosine kinase
LKKAIEKAKEARKTDGLIPVQSGEILSPPLDQAIKLYEPVCEEINPAYCQTRCVRVDPRILKRNKIVSLFHEEAMADQLKILRTQVLNKMEEIGGNSLLVTSANPFEGKTLTAINLAVSISHKIEHTVLLVDADLRKPSIHEYFGLDISRGLSDYLLRQAEIPELLVNPEIEKLVLLPGGKPLANSAEHLGAPRMESLVNEMKARYPERFIVFDSPSLLCCADPLVCSRFTDGILLVVEAERTPEKDIGNALELLSGRTLIGTVLNKAVV